MIDCILLDAVRTSWKVMQCVGVECVDGDCDEFAFCSVGVDDMIVVCML